MQIICYIKKLKNYSYPPKIDDILKTVYVFVKNDHNEMIQKLFYSV